MSLIDLLRQAGDDSNQSMYHLEEFDHENCHDCSYVQVMTDDCSRHLKELTVQTSEASQRLILLVELRERVREVGEILPEEDVAVDDSFFSTSPKRKTSNKEGGDSSSRLRASTSAMSASSNGLGSGDSGDDVPFRRTNTNIDVSIDGDEDNNAARSFK